MNYPGKILFENRSDAGRQLAQKLEEYYERSVVVLGIPNGGVPLALEIASELKADLELIICRKIPAPLNPEAGFGAVADDGTIIINQEALDRIGLNQEQVNNLANQVRAKVKERSMLYKSDRPLTRLAGRTVIIVDDGLASGYTMLAAVESVRNRRAKFIIVAVPVASELALEQVKKVADKVVTCATGPSSKPFHLSDYYRHWRDVTDDEVLKCLEQWRKQKFFGTVR